MIDKRELRAGNFVNVPHGDVKIAFLIQEGVHLVDDCGGNWRSLEPIPLSTEWLERFGFKLIDMMFENVPMRYWRKDFMIVEESFVVILYNDKETPTTVNVGHVHQLQNLWFILEGKELELKP